MENKEDIFRHLLGIFKQCKDIDDKVNLSAQGHSQNMTLCVFDKSQISGVLEDYPFFSLTTEYPMVVEAEYTDPCFAHPPYHYKDLTQYDAVRIAFVIAYIVIILTSLIGNMMVILTISRNKHMRTITNYYIMNLAICDFIVALVVMPLKLLEYTAPCSWHIFQEDILCSICSFGLPAFVFASVLTLVAISIERYYAILHPITAMTQHSKSRTRKILIATWVVPLLLCLPNLFGRSYAFNIQSAYGTASRQICDDRFDDVDDVIGVEAGSTRKGYFMFLFITMYLVPLLIILVTCVRIAKCLLTPINQDSAESNYGVVKMTKRKEESKRRVARMVIAVAVSFLICWTPLYAVSVISQLQEQSFLKEANFLFTELFVHLIGFMNSAINPFIYHFMSERFRKSFKNILVSLLCCFAPLFRIATSRKHSWSNDYQPCHHHAHGNQGPNRDMYFQYKPRPPLPPTQLNERYKSKKIQRVKHEPTESDIPSSQVSAKNDKKAGFRKDFKKTKDKQSGSQESGTHIKNEKISIKNNDKTVLMCGPFCVCGCQSCSLHSSSLSENSSDICQGVVNKNCSGISLYTQQQKTCPAETHKRHSYKNKKPSSRKQQPGKREYMELLAINKAPIVHEPASDGHLKICGGRDQGTLRQEANTCSNTKLSLPTTVTSCSLTHIPWNAAAAALLRNEDRNRLSASENNIQSQLRELAAASDTSLNEEKDADVIENPVIFHRSLSKDN